MFSVLTTMSVNEGFKAYRFTSIHRIKFQSESISLRAVEFEEPVAETLHRCSHGNSPPSSTTLL